MCIALIWSSKSYSLVLLITGNLTEGVGFQQINDTNAQCERDLVAYPLSSDPLGDYKSCRSTPLFFCDSLKQHTCNVHLAYLFSLSRRTQCSFRIRSDNNRSTTCGPLEARCQCYELQIWPVHSEGPSEQKPIKNFGEKGASAYSGIQGLSNFSGTPYYLRNEKSYGFQIWSVHSEGPSE